MKRFLLLSNFITLFFLNNNFAQCPGCVIDWGCPANFPNGGICQAVLPQGTVGVSYDSDVSFYMPSQFVDGGTGYTIILNQITITGISGLPFGFNWECDQSSNACNYYPTSNPPTTEMGCVKFCGTPIGLPGVYDITVYIVAQVHVVDLNIDVTQNETYLTQVEILPNASGNPYFTYSPTSGCDSLNVTFEALVDGAPNPTSYNWDFANGQTSNLKNPPAQDYNLPGEYYVSLNTTINHYTVQDVNLTSSNNNWCGDIEEPDLPIFGCTSSPDIIFTLFDFNSNVIYTSSEITDQNPPLSWSGVNVELSEPGLTIFFQDIDLISQNDDLGTFVMNITGTGSYPFSGANGTSGNIIIGTTPYQSYDVVDTIFVYASPTVPEISNLTTDEDSICLGDTVTLLASTDGEFFQWYNDTTIIPGATDSLLQVLQTGNYWVMVNNQHGCYSSSALRYIKVFNLPPPPSWFFNTGNHQLMSTNPGSNSVQWWLNGSPLIGDTGYYYTVTQDGYYQVQLTNVIGCTSISDSFQILVSSIGAELVHPIASTEMYPNPSDGNFTIKIELPVEQEITIEIIDNLGKLIYIKESGMQRGIFSENIFLNRLSNGVYFVIIKSDFDQTINRFVISR